MNRSVKFSLAVSGNGHMSAYFLSLLRIRFPDVIIYDRNEEPRRPPSTALIPPHPQVADIDASFIRAGFKEMATIRSRNGHRFFNYVSESAATVAEGQSLLLQRFIQAVEELL